MRCTQDLGAHLRPAHAAAARRRCSTSTSTSTSARTTRRRSGACGRNEERSERGPLRPVPPRSTARRQPPIADVCEGKKQEVKERTQSIIMNLQSLRPAGETFCNLWTRYPTFCESCLLRAAHSARAAIAVASSLLSQLSVGCRKTFDTILGRDAFRCANNPQLAKQPSDQ